MQIGSHFATAPMCWFIIWNITRLTSDSPNQCFLLSVEPLEINFGYFYITVHKISAVLFILECVKKHVLSALHLSALDLLGEIITVYYINYISLPWLKLMHPNIIWMTEYKYRHGYTSFVNFTECDMICLWLAVNLSGAQPEKSRYV